MLSNKRLKPSRPGVVATVVLGGVVVGDCVVAGGAVVVGAGVVVGDCVVTGGAVKSGDVEGAAVLGFVDAAEDNTNNENVSRLTLHRRAASADFRTETDKRMEPMWRMGNKQIYLTDWARQNPHHKSTHSLF